MAVPYMVTNVLKPLRARAMLLALVVLSLPLLVEAAPQLIRRLNNREVSLELERPERLRQAVLLSEGLIGTRGANTTVAQMKASQLSNVFEKWHRLRDIQILRGGKVKHTDMYVKQQRHDFAELLWTLYRADKKTSAEGETVRIGAIPVLKPQDKVMNSRLVMHWMTLLSRTNHRVAIQKSGEYSFLSPKRLTEFLSRGESQDVHDLFVLIVKAADIADAHFIAQLRKKGVELSEEQILSMSDDQISAVLKEKGINLAELKLTLEEATRMAENGGLRSLADIRLKFDHPKIYASRARAEMVKGERQFTEFESEIKRLIDIYHEGDESLKDIFMDQFAMHIFGMRLGNAHTLGTYRMTGTTGTGKSNFPSAITRAVLIYNATHFSQKDAAKLGITWYPIEDINEAVVKKHLIFLAGPEHKSDSSMTNIIGAGPRYVGGDGNQALLSPENILAKQVGTAVVINGKWVVRRLKNFVIDEAAELHPTILRLLLTGLDGSPVRIYAKNAFHDVYFKDMFVWLNDNLLQQYLIESANNILGRKFDMLGLQKLNESLENSLSVAEFDAWKQEIAIASMRDFKTADGRSPYPPQLLARIPFHLGSLPPGRSTLEVRLRMYIYKSISEFNKTRNEANGEMGIPMDVDFQVIQYLLDKANPERGTRSVTELVDELIIRPMNRQFLPGGKLKLGNIITVSMVGPKGSQRVEMKVGEPLYLKEARQFNEEAFLIKKSASPSVSQVAGQPQQPQASKPAPPPIPKNMKNDGAQGGAAGLDKSGSSWWNDAQAWFTGFGKKTAVAPPGEARGHGQ